MDPANANSFYRSTQRMNPVIGIIAARESVIDQIKEFFAKNPCREFSSGALHNQFGTGFRSRVSDINIKPEYSVGYGFVIHNRHFFDESAKCERSFYWSEPKDMLF